MFMHEKIRFIYTFPMAKYIKSLSFQLFQQSIMVLNSKNIGLLISLLFIVYSCDTETLIEFEYPVYENKLVVQGFISNKEGAIVTVNKSLPPLTHFSDSVDIAVKGASVQLYADNKPAFFLNEIEQGKFLSPDTFIPKLNIAYYIEASALGYDLVKSSIQYLPSPVSVDSAFVFEEGFFHILKIKYCDPDLNKNFYYYRRHIFYNGDKEAEEYFNSSNNYYPLFHPANVIYDEAFNGNCYSFQDQVYITYWKNDNFSIKADSVMIKLYSLSHDLVAYLESLDEFEFAKDDMWQENPIFIYTNINDGYGILGTYYESDVVLKIK